MEMRACERSPGWQQGLRLASLLMATLFAGMLALAPPGIAQAEASVSVSVDATAPGAPLARVWSFHGYDEINYTTVPEGKALLGTLAAMHSAAVHVRNHFLFNTGDGTPAMKWGSTNVYAEDAAGNPVYDWTLTDGILDTLVAVGASPFVQIGFMPQALSRRPTPYRNAATLGLDGGCFYPPTDYGKWADLVHTWATHAVARYPDVAGRWLWELWNEPDIGYWHGTFAEYAQLYDHTEAALHAVLPSAALGGPAVVNPDGDFLGQFLEHCATGTNAVTGATGTRLDLVTFHAKGGVAMNDGHVAMNLGHQLRLHRAGFQKVAGFPQLEQTPIYITEADPEGCAACPASSAPEYAYRNSTAYGAYEVAMMKHTLDLADEIGVKLGGVLTWAFTFPGTPYFAGHRALATNGIHLPVLGAFKLLGQLTGARLPVASGGARGLGDILAHGVRGEPDIDGMATVDGASVQVLVWNYHDDVTSAVPAPVSLTIKLPASFGARVRVSHLRVDEAHGDAHALWVSQGMPVAPTASQLAALHQGMEPSPLQPEQPQEDLRVIADGTVKLDFALPRFAVSLVTLRPTPDGASGADEGWAGGGGGCGCTVDPGGEDNRGCALLGMLGWALVRVLRRRRV